MIEPPEDPIYSAPPLYTWRLVITSLFFTCMIAGLLLSVKSIRIIGLDEPGGSLIFPLTYSFVIITSEVYGFRTAERMVYIGLFNLLLVAAAVEVVVHAPASSFYPKSLALTFNVLFGASVRFIVVAIIGYITGQEVTIRLYRFIHRHGGGRMLYVRIFAAPCAAQIIALLISIPLAYGTTIPSHEVGILLYNRVWLAIVQSVISAPAIWGAVLFLRRLEKLGQETHPGYIQGK